MQAGIARFYRILSAIMVIALAFYVCVDVGLKLTGQERIHEMLSPAAK